MESPAPLRPGLAATLVLGAVSLGISLLAAELVVRIFLADRVSTEKVDEQLRERSIAALVRPSQDPALYYELRPDLDTTFRGRHVFTSDSSYRISRAAFEGGASALEGAVQVALVGDSTAFGWGVEYEDTYGEQFRRRMQERTGAEIDLRNYSVPGYNASQETIVFLERAAERPPDLVILHHDHNDAEATGELYPPNYFPAEYGDNPLNSALLKLGVRETRALWNRLARVLEGRGDEFLGGARVGGPLYEEHLMARRRLLEEANRLGAPVVMVLFHAAVEPDPDWRKGEEYRLLHRALEEKLRALGFRVLDLYPLYQDWLARNQWPDMTPWWVTPDDAHPNREGHAFIAEALVELVRADSALAAVFSSDSLD
jgi:lysophospholipase L1-like esterase